MMPTRRFIAVNDLLTRFLSCALPGGANIFAVVETGFLSEFVCVLRNPETCALGNASSPRPGAFLRKPSSFRQLISLIRFGNSFLHHYSTHTHVKNGADELVIAPQIWPLWSWSI